MLEIVRHMSHGQIEENNHAVYGVAMHVHPARLLYLRKQDRPEQKRHHKGRNSRTIPQHPHSLVKPAPMMGRRVRRGGREGGRERARSGISGPEVSTEEEHGPVGKEDEPFDVHVVIHHTEERGRDGDAHWKGWREGGRERLSEGNKNPA